MISKFQTRQAAAIIQSGGIIAYQTDSLYGLSCDPYNEHAVDSLNNIKQRPGGKTFILIASAFEQIAPLLAASTCDQLDKLSPADKPVSWIVAASDQTPAWLKSNDHSIAIRLSNDPITHALCTLLQRPLVSTSANISGRPSASNALQCRKIFGRQIDMFLKSSHRYSGKPSQLRRLCDNALLRP